MEGKYVYLLEQENDNVKITYIDNPIILKLDTTTTTNSINVKVKAYNLKDEEYVYYIKKETSDEDFKKEKTSNSSEYTYENLQQNMGYLVKVVVKTKPNKETELTKRVVLGGVTDGTEEGAINFGATTWNETTHKASVNITTKTSYKIQYQINPTTENLTDNTKWIQIASGNSVANLSLNDKVYARLWDGNNGGSPATFKLTEDIAPEVSLALSGNATTNSVTVVADAVDKQAGMPENATYTFFIKEKEQADTAYVQIQSSTNKTCTKTGLKQTTDYTMKVETTDIAGNTGTKTLDFKTGTVGVATGLINFDNTTWNETTHKASVRVSTTQSYSIQYQINPTTEDLTDNTKWISIASGNSVTSLSLNDKVYARLWDGNNGGSPATFILTEDIAPEVSLALSGNATTNSVTVVADAVDKQAGMPENATYTFFIKEKEQADTAYIQIQSSTNKTCTKTGLKQTTDYTMKVETTDIAGNTGTKTLDFKTGTVGVATGLINFDNTTWNETTHKASVRVSTTQSYSIQYQINPTTEDLTDNTKWISIASGNSVTSLSLNDKVYARLWDGNNGGSPATFILTEDIAPEVSLALSGNATTNSVTVVADAVDKQAGMPENATYTFFIKEKEQADTAYVQIQSSTNKTCTKTGLKQTTDYTMKVETTDIAGNTGTKTLDFKTGTVGAATGLINFDNTTWNETTHKASVRVSTTQSYSIQYQINPTTEDLTDNTKWIPIASGNSVPNLSLNDKVYARLWDGNNGGSQATFTLTEDIAPEVSLALSGDVTTNSVIVVADAVDKQAGMPENATYTFFIKEKEQADTAYVQIQSSTNKTCTKTGLKQTTDYTMKVETTDIAGNTGTKTLDFRTGTIGAATGLINFDNTSWNANTHKASVRVSTTQSYSIQYQINPTTENLTDNTKWIQIASGNSVPNLSLNDKVYARLWDGNNGGSPATFILTEDIAPKAEITLTAVTEVTGETITATVTQSDDQSGITNFANCKWVYNTTSGKIGTDATKYTGTFSQSPEELKLTATTAGTYYLHVLTIDAAGNKKETISKAITISTAPNATAVLKAGDYVQYTPTSKSFSMTTAQTGHSTAQSFATGDYTGLWQVLYNDSTNGLQLISADSVGYLYIKGATGYNKILTTLNTFCKNYENSTFTITDSGRTVGSNPTSSSTDTTTNESLVFNTSTGLKSADTRYTTDYEAMKKATSQNASGIQNIGGYYWLPSRKVFKTSDVGYFSIYTVANGGEVEYRRMKDMYVTGSNYEFEYAYGVRPVVKIKDGIKAIRGNGSSSNPYQIRQ